MTKKHFDAFAAEIRASSQSPVTKVAMALLIMRVASKFNPPFDLERFLKAAGVSE